MKIGPYFIRTVRFTVFFRLTRRIHAACTMPLERSSGDLSRSFVGGTAQRVEDGANAKDGVIWLFVSADWADMDLKPPPLVVSRGNHIPVHVNVLDNLLQASVVIVLQGRQCGALHLALVAHCREYLWSITPRSTTMREMEGMGVVDYINILWAIDSSFGLYRSVTSSVGLCEHIAADGSAWDAFWYIYRRGENTPAYSHIGLDTSASLHRQTHVADKVRPPRECPPHAPRSRPRSRPRAHAREPRRLAAAAAHVSEWACARAAL